MSHFEEIECINFGHYSADEIIKNAVCKITENKLSGDGSLYDRRMGILEENGNCMSCKLSYRECPGHFGYIQLNTPILHPLYHRHIISFLKCFCFSCYKLVITKDHLYLNSILKFKNEKRFNLILEILEKIDSCQHCQHVRTKIIYNITESTIELSTKNKKIVLNDEDIKKIFDNVVDSDVELLGFNPNMTHPKNLVLTCLPVMPPVSRPYVITDGKMSDDDLTMSYLEIIKANNALEAKDLTETRRSKHIMTIKFRIKTLMNNSSGKAKHNTNQRPLKGIKERLTGKDGIIRNNLMGKRTNQSGRTVIGPDPTVRTDEMVIPQQIANTLTVPERVNTRNKEYLEYLVNNGKANHILLGGNTLIHIKYASRTKNNNGGFDKKYIRLNVGDVVERHLKNGDIVLLNRQPTLHKCSMLAKKIIIRPHKTFRFSLATTKPFNADFDGDEMNIHVPQDYDARAELIALASTKHNIMNSQSSKSNISIVQDSMLGAYLMTKKSDIIPINTYNDILLHGDGWDMEFINKKRQHIKNTLQELGEDVSILYTGKGLISMMLPDDFFYTKKTEANPIQPIVKIYKGVLYEGAFNKSVIGSSHNSIIQVLHKEYDVDVCIKFINNIQFITNAWLCHYSFTIGLEDCIVKKGTEQLIRKTVMRHFMEAKNVQETTQHPRIKEARINAALGKAKDIGMKLAREAMHPDNGFVSTVVSGSKGDFFNIAQISGIVGQQNLMGHRVEPVLNRGLRTLPHYQFGQLDLEDEFESRGFVRNSFLKGLNPKEFWFHSMSGREGVSDSAMKTAVSGYIHRKMVKVLEDVQIKYDGSVRNSQGSIIQWAYGDDDMDRSQTVVLDQKSHILDVNRLAHKLNNLYESDLKSKNTKI